MTLTGPGGVGKTRLALEAARAVEADFADGACFVSLAAVQRPEDVPAAIVSALGIILLAGESPSQAAERFLAAKHLLLVADNFEHVLAAAPFIGGLLGACPALTVLATSREPLALQAEERYPVPPLALPELATPEDPRRWPATTRSRCSSSGRGPTIPTFDLSDGNAAAVAEICRRVDGLPLAIELAAARCGLLSPAEIAERLDVALGAPGAAARDAPARHHTLRATIDWSHELLSDDEQACFARFAVFAGGATIEAAQTITGADLDTLDHLVAKSLLVRRRQRAHAHQAADARDDPRLRRRALRGSRRRRCRPRAPLPAFPRGRRAPRDRAAAAGGGRQGAPQRVSTPEIHNFDAALRWAVGRPDAGPALAMVAALCSYWDLRERYAADAVDWIDRALALPGAEDHPAERARARCRPRPSRCDGAGASPRGPRSSPRPKPLPALSAIPSSSAKVLIGCSAWWSIAGRPDAADAVADEALRCATAADDEWEIALAWRYKASGGPRSPRVARARRSSGRAAGERRQRGPSSASCSAMPPTTRLPWVATATRESSPTAQRRSCATSTTRAR